MDWHVHFLCKYSDFLQRGIRYGVGCVRAESNIDQVIAAKVVMQAQPFIEVVIRPHAPRGREIQHGKGELAAYLGIQAGLCGLFRVKIHIRKTGGPAFYHLC